MKNENGILPPAGNLDISRLEGIFRNTTNSYKHLLVRAIFTWVEKFPEVFSLTYPQLQMLMLLDAAEPLCRYRLSFGIQDDTKKLVDKLFECQQDLSEKKNKIVFTIFAGKTEDSATAKMIDNLSLMRYVPARLLKPWFAEQLRGLPDYRRDKRIEELSRECFEDEDICPLYRIIQPGRHKAIELHPAWKEYIRANLPIVKGWCLLKWLLYLQKRNQHVPMLTAKIFPPTARSSLEPQRKFWKPVVSAGFKCIYTTRKIEPDNFVLDHFLPFDWVGHDQLWNLVPTSEKTNSLKSNKIPPKSLIDKLAQAHWQALKCNGLNKRPYTRKVDDYLNGLNMSFDDLCSPESLRVKYQQHLKPSIDQALYSFDKLKL